jgi:two-component system sensor histidine kinase/response regulator
MLTSGDLQEVASRCRDLGVAATMLKPLKQSELQRTLVSTLSYSPNRTPCILKPALVPEIQQIPPLRLLLAEDNPVNQRVAVRMLEKQGHTVHVAVNGQIALDAISEHEFDAVFMDVQMPVMDGMEAVGVLRQRESLTGRHLPVIAMTAHAMSGDRERCLAAGMDEYVSKPIEQRELAAALGRVLLLMEKRADRQAVLFTDGDTTPVCDLTAALAQLDGDNRFLKEMAELFLNTIPEQLVALQAATDARNLAEVSELAHLVRGSLATFCAHPAYDAALTLERTSRAGKFEHLMQMHEELVSQVERLSDALRTELLELTEN